MAVVPIIIDGQKYNLSCDEGQEDRLASIGRTMDKKAASIRRAFPQISDNLLLVMIGVLLAEEAYMAKIDANPDYEDVALKEDKYAEALNHILEKIENLAKLV